MIKAIVLVVHCWVGSHFHDPVNASGAYTDGLVHVSKIANERVDNPEVGEIMAGGNMLPPKKACLGSGNFPPKKYQTGPDWDPI